MIEVELGCFRWIPRLVPFTVLLYSTHLILLIRFINLIQGGLSPLVHLSYVIISQLNMLRFSFGWLLIFICLPNKSLPPKGFQTFQILDAIVQFLIMRWWGSYIFFNSFYSFLCFWQTKSQDLIALFLRFLIGMLVILVFYGRFARPYRKSWGNQSLIYLQTLWKHP